MIYPRCRRVKWQHVVIDRCFLNWETLFIIKESRSQGLIIACTAINIRALNLIKTLEFPDKKQSDFVASVGWCNLFMTRHKSCVRASMKLPQKLPSQLEDKVEVFQWYIIQVHKNHHSDLLQIGNVDETTVLFDLPSNYMVDRKVVKTVFVKTTGHE